MAMSKNDDQIIIFALNKRRELIVEVVSIAITVNYSCPGLRRAARDDLRDYLGLSSISVSCEGELKGCELLDVVFNVFLLTLLWIKNYG
jgi:hypothetical protein